MRHPLKTQGCQRPDQSFSKQDRLLIRREFLATTRRGRRYTTRYFLVFLRSNRKGRPRLGVVVSKKVGKAIRRNYLKRRLREFFRLHKPWLPTSTDIVIVAKKGIPNLTYREICRDLERFLQDPSRPSVRTQRRAKHAQPDPGRGDKNL